MRSVARHAGALALVSLLALGWGPTAQGSMSPLSWRWYDGSIDLSPTPLAPQNHPLWGVGPGTPLRLRMAHSIGNPSLSMSLVYRELAFAGSWQTVGTGALLWGAATDRHGQPLDSTLLLGTAMPGIYLDHPAPPMGASTGTTLENDYSLVLDRLSFRPQTRYVVAPSTEQSASTLPLSGFDTNGADLCTRSGAPILAPNELLRWNLSVSPVYFVDADGDGTIDILQRDVSEAAITGMRAWLYRDSETFTLGQWVTFGGAQQYPADRTPLCAGDWEGDGDGDLLAWDSSLKVLVLQRNDGGLAFTAGSTIANSSNTQAPFWCTLGDWDADGDLDILQSRSTGTTWMRNTGTRAAPTYAAPVSVILGGAAMSMVSSIDGATVHDWDGDGLQDLVITLFSAVRVYRNIGTAAAPDLSAAESFPWSTSVGDAASAPLFADWNTDGFTDVLIAVGTGVAMWPGAAIGTPPDLTLTPLRVEGELIAFATPLRPSVFRLPKAVIRDQPGTHVLVVDGAGDVWHLFSYSQLDTADSEDTVPPLPRNRHRLALAAGGYVAATPPGSAAVVDWNHDGAWDVVIGTGTGDVLLHLNENNNVIPLFGAATPITTPSGTARVESDAVPTIADVDGDSLWDLVIGAGNGSITFFRNQGSEGNPSFADGAPWTTADGPLLVPGGDAAPSITDWDDDGLLDVVTGANNGAVYWARNLGPETSPLFATPQAIEGANGPFGLSGLTTALVADWDGVDCARDLLFADSTGVLSIARGSILAASAPTPLTPVGNTALTVDASALLTNPPTLTWTAVSEPSAAAFSYRVELALRSDFMDAIELSTPSGDIPPTSVSPATPLMEDRRYFWRAYAQNEHGNRGATSTIETFVIAPTDTTPVITAPASGRDGSPRLGQLEAGDVGAAAARDANVDGLLAEDTRQRMTESGSGAYQLQWFYEIASLPLVGRLHPELVLITEVRDALGDAADETVWVEVFRDSAYVRLGALDALPVEKVFPLLPFDLADGRVAIRLVDDGADAVSTEVAVDWCALRVRNAAPIAQAGMDREVAPDASVLLDASASTDPDGDALTYHWRQIDGPAATLATPDAQVARFSAPATDSGVTLAFELTVSDGELSSSDVVLIAVRDQSVSVADLVRVAPGPATTAARSVTSGTRAVPVMQLSLTHEGTSSVRLEALTPTLHLVGNGINRVEAAYLVLDDNGNGELDGGESVLATVSNRRSGALAFAPLDLDLVVSRSAQILLMVDLPAEASLGAVASGLRHDDLDKAALVVILASALWLLGRLRIPARRRWRVALAILALTSCWRVNFEPPTTQLWFSFDEPGAITARSVPGDLLVLPTGLPVASNRLDVRSP